jgi:hypothetical protein
VLQHARAQPEAIAIGIDASADALRDTSRKAGSNALFFVSDALLALHELRGCVDDLRVTLPWGALLRWVLEGEREFALAVAGSL